MVEYCDCCWLLLELRLGHRQIMNTITRLHITIQQAPLDGDMSQVVLSDRVSAALQKLQCSKSRFNI